MIRRILLISCVFVLVAVISFGCSYVRVGGGGWTSPDEKYFVEVFALSALGRSYLEVTKKQVDIMVFGRKHVTDDYDRLIRRKIIISDAGDMFWRAHWLNNTTAIISFYDYNNLGRNKARKEGVEPRLILNISIKYNENIGMFEIKTIDDKELGSLNKTGTGNLSDEKQLATSDELMSQETPTRAEPGAR